MAAVILAGDVGGTKTHLALFRTDAGRLGMLRDYTYATSAYPSLEAVVAAFLGRDDRCSRACFGVPGPVIDGRSHATNVPWTMEEGALGRALGGASVRLINDLQATAHGVVHLPANETAVLQRGTLDQTPENIAVIAAGTGLGEAALIPTTGGPLALASEGGHCDFAPRGPDQLGLLGFLAREFDHVSVERVLSGPGLHNIYRYVASLDPAAQPDWLARRLKTEDPPAVIGEVALAGTDPGCVRALDLMVAIYGAEAANLALKLMAVGGVWLGGGIAPKILPALERGFVRAFCNKGRLAPLLERVPVRVALNPAAALHGAAYFAAAML